MKRGASEATSGPAAVLPDDSRIGRGLSLTLRQRLFVLEYLADPELNATRAYKRAGYRAVGNAAEAGASRLLRSAKVQAMIEGERRERLQRLRIDSDAVVRRLFEIAMATVTDFISWDDRGNVELVQPSQIVPGRLSALKYLHIGDSGVRIALADRTALVELLGRHLGLF